MYPVDHFRVCDLLIPDRETHHEGEHELCLGERPYSTCFPFLRPDGVLLGHNHWRYGSGIVRYWCFTCFLKSADVFDQCMVYRRWPQTLPWASVESHQTVI